MKRAAVETVLKRLRIQVAQKRGDRIWALCPFHDDHSPSWMIRWRGKRRGQFHCFVCKEGGSLPELVQKLRGFSLLSSAKEWLEELALKEGEEVAPDELPVSIRLEVPTQVRGFELPEEVIEEPLETWVTPARAYALERHLTAEQVARWGIGYAVDGKLEGRIVLVVRNRQGQPVNYHARDFTKDKRAKRYLYPSGKENPNMDVLFGEHLWSSPSSSRVVVCEGALNALAVERATGDAVAALGGSDLRPFHVMKLAMFREIVILTDPDLAGDKVAEELEGALSRHRIVRRVRLGSGEDADSIPVEKLRQVLA